VGDTEVKENGEGVFYLSWNQGRSW